MNNKKIKNLLTLVGVGFIIFQALSFSQILKADQKIKVLDGDSFILNKSDWRLWGIDAPELYQRCALKKSLKQMIIKCGQLSKEFLKKLMLLPIKCKIIEIDRFKRNIGFCKNAQGIDIASEMVANGWAFDYRRYSNFYFDQEEKQAKKQNLGMWQYDFLWPWHWRKENPKK